MAIAAIITKQGAIVALGVGLPLALVTKADAINVSFDYSFDTGNYQTSDGNTVTGFFTEGVTYEDGSTGEQRRNALETAASYYESAFSDNLNAINPTGGINSWNAVLTDPTNGGTQTVSNLQLDQNEVLIYVGAQDVDAAAFAGPGGYQVFPNTEFGNNVLSRGQGTTLGAEANDFSLWGGQITFDSSITASGFDLDWYWDSEGTDGLTNSHVDFLSVAVHELGHVFGFGLADSFDNLVTEINGELFFTGETTAELFGESLVPLSTEDGGGHFEEGLHENELALDPLISVGERNLLTALDYAVFADIGWQVDPSLLGQGVGNPVAVPTPSALGSMLFMLGGMLTRRRRV
ncbi:hypothetical protein JD969_02310 [Planctomycetota bacterium]|nr:hypothetical protein JD969_02310 [Planctomycetota bacterium]